MFCPQCGQIQSSRETSFCSACGFELRAVALIMSGGANLTTAASCLAPPPGSAPINRGRSPRHTGVLHGAMLMASCMLVVPLMVILGVLMLHLPVEFIPATAIFCVMGGFLRIIYALMFQPGEAQLAEVPAPLQVPAFVPARMSTPPLNPYSGGQWRAPNTGEIRQPLSSVTDQTTRLLHHDSLGARER
jgi:hypothetical protein